MAEKKMTRLEALNIAVLSVDNADAREVLLKMAEQLAKPRKKAEGPTKARRENERLAADLVAAIDAHGERVTPKWVTEHVKGIMTPQKAVAVARVAEELGTIIKEKEGKATYYKLA